VRLLVVAAVVALAGDGAAGVLWVLAAALGILYLVVEPTRLWREVHARRPSTEPAGADV
jgi:hypothetical protein